VKLVEGRAAIDDLDAFLDTIDSIATAHGSTIQVFDARYIADRTHLKRAVELATRAQERNEMIARKLSVEILLYAAGRRQIERAMAMGVSEGSCSVVAVVLGGDEERACEAVSDQLEPESTLSTVDSERLADFFDVTDAERRVADDLASLVHERVAMLAVNS
jgi:KEOPS complex subunit Cgi121